MTGVYGAYIATEAFCIVFSLILLFRLKCGLGSDREIKILRSMFIWYVVLLAADMFWAMTEDDAFVSPKLLNGAINAMADTAVSWGCYYWYRFVAERSGRYERLGKTAKLLLVLPAAVISLMLFASIFSGWMFFIDENNHFQDTPLVYLRVGADYFYLLLATFSPSAARFAPAPGRSGWNIWVMPCTFCSPSRFISWKITASSGRWLRWSSSLRCWCCI